MSWAASKYGPGGEPVTAEKTGEDGSGGVDKSAAANLELQKRAKEIADQIDIPDADYDIRFASAKEIKAVTKGQAAWGTVTKVNGRWTILMEETLSTRMDGTRFIQTVAEELVHVEQLSTGYYKNLNPSTRRYALETEATGWVMSYAPTLGLKGADYRDYTKIHNMWESKWKKQLY
jgi:hypothetical protein